MVKNSSKLPSDFNNKYFTPLFMDKAIDDLFEKDVEILYSSSPISSAVFFYCDDLTEDELLAVYNHMEVTPSIDVIPVLEESDFDNIKLSKESFWDFCSKVMGSGSKLFKVVEVL